MDSLNACDAAGPPRVACETLDGDRVPVDLGVMRRSGTFKKMCDDLGLEEHNGFPGTFPVTAISTRIFKKVVEWCKEYGGEPKPLIEEDPLTRECKWFVFSEAEHRFFDVPATDLLQLIAAASFLDIPRLYEYACQAVAACIKVRSPPEHCNLLQQDCDLDKARIMEIRKANPWLSSVPHGVHIEAGYLLSIETVKQLLQNAVGIPSEVLLNIFKKLPREDLERLQLVNTRFDAVIEGSAELSEHQGPRRVVSKVEFGAYSRGRFSQGIHVTLPDGARVTCPNYENLAKRLRFAIVQTMRAGYSGDSTGILGPSTLVPVKAAWKDASVEACFPTSAVFEFVFTHLLLCKKITLLEGCRPLNRQEYTSIPGIAACSTLNISELINYEVEPALIIEWLEHEVPPVDRRCGQREMILSEAITGGIRRLLAALKTAFAASSVAKPSTVYIKPSYYIGNVDDVRSNEKTRELLTVGIANGYVFAKRT